MKVNFLPDSHAMKNKTCLLILLVLAVFSLANAQNNQELRVNDSLGDYEVDDELNDDFTTLTYSFKQFEKNVDAIHYQNYKKQMCTPLEGQYVSTFIQGMDESFMIVAISNQGFNEEIENAKYEHFIHNGRDYYFGKILNEEQGKFDNHILLLECPQYDIVISIMSPTNLSKENLLGIVNQLDL
ncbi:MAG: hypothetical protein ACI93S_001744 [Ancylomarina sp.]|jgi:hypothetical protein